MNKKFILYIGQLNKGGTCLDRMHALEAMSFSVTPFDVSTYADPIRLLNSIAYRYNFGRKISLLNRDLVGLAEKYSKKIDYIWVDKGRWIYPETLISLKKLTNSTLIHYTPDPQIFIHKSRYFEKSIPLYDFVITTKPFETERYKELGAKKVLFNYQSYDENRFYPRERNLSYSCDVGLIGHYRKYYADVIMSAQKATDHIKIWGMAWNKARVRYPCLMKYYQGGPVIGDDYPVALSSTKICLGLLDKTIPETTTTRSFEIPACGAFMLAERTDDHLALFKEHVEAEFFASKEEMIEKIRYYLSNERERRKIAMSGRERCIKSGYDTSSRLKQILGEIQQ